jgi:multidrug transporter EmrE-like cation transporter
MILNELIDPLLPSSKIGILVTFAICIAFFEAIAQNSLKYYSENAESCSDMIICVGVVGYIMVALLLLTSYNYVAMSKMNLMWSCISIVAACALGNIIHHEDFDGYTASSVSLALLSIYVAHLGEQESK